jgi:phosphodiesterase/alkaline phosphatase D-like protein
MKKLKKQSLIKILIPIVVLACAVAYALVPGTKTVAQQGMRAAKATAAHYELIDSVDALNIHQVITQDSASSRTFMWQSQLEENDAVLEYRIKGSEDALILSAENEKFSDDNTTTYIHTVTVQDLQPGSDYEYRVGYGKKRSDWMSFRTAAGDNFKALIFPDSQSSDYSAWAQTMRPAWQANKDAQFFVNMGDLVDNGQDHYQWNAWFDVVEPMISQIPVVPTLGNHETYDRDWKVRMPEAYLHLFSLPKVSPSQYQN